MVDDMRSEEKNTANSGGRSTESNSLALVLGRIEGLEQRLKVIEQLVKSRRKRPDRFSGKLIDETFRPLAHTVLGHRRTLLGQDRLFVLWQCVRNIAPARVPAVEVGAYRGGSAYFIASAFRTLLGQEVPMHVIDTFEGHPAAKVSSFDPYHKPGMFSDISYEDVRAYLSAFALLQVHKGEFSEMVTRLPETSYGLVHIDVDLYRTTLECLTFFGERLAAGGVIVLDDFGARKCPGVEKAVSEYLEAHHPFQVWQMPTEQLLIVGS